MAGSKDRAMILTITCGEGVVPGISGDVRFGLDGTDTHPQINTIKIKAITRIPYLFWKKVYRNSWLFFIFDIQDSMRFFIVGLDYNGV